MIKTTNTSIRSALALALVAGLAATACTKSGGEDSSGSGGSSAPAAAAAAGAQSKGVGPVTEVKLEALNADLAGKGKSVFTAKCSACHKIDERFVGPALKGVTQRRQPEWIMNMILNPAEMTQKDPVAKELLGEFLTQMTFQNVSQDEARQILEYFRQNDGGSK